MEEVDVRPKCARWKAFGTIVVVCVCVCGIPLQGVKIAFRARYVVYNTRQAVVKQHSSYVIAYDSQLVLVRKRICVLIYSFDQCKHMLNMAINK